MNVEVYEVNARRSFGCYVIKIVNVIRMHEGYAFVNCKKELR